MTILIVGMGACHEASSISCSPVPKFNNMFNSEGQVVDKSVYFSANDQGAWVHTEDESLSPSKQPLPSTAPTATWRGTLTTVMEDTGP